MTEKILVSRPEAARLIGTTTRNLRTLVSRGRLVEADALIEGVVRKGVTLASMAAYFGWSPRVVDDVLTMHGVNPDSDGYHWLVGPDD